MTRSVLLLPVLAAVAFAASGCTNEEPGIADPQPEYSTSLSTSPPSSTDTNGTGSSLEPCSLLDPAEDLSEYGRFTSKPGSNDEGASEKICSWQKQRDDALDESLVVGLVVRGAQSVETVNDVGGGVNKGEVNGRAAAEAPNPQFHDCTLAMELDAGSRIDVVVSGMDDVNAACDVAREVAYLVEPRLPEA
jgi:hypothetical protein